MKNDYLYLLFSWIGSYSELDITSIIERANKITRKYIRIVELCNLYRLRKEDPNSILDMICDIIYDEDKETITIEDVKKGK